MLQILMAQVLLGIAALMFWYFLTRTFAMIRLSEQAFEATMQADRRMALQILSLFVNLAWA